MPKSSKRTKKNRAAARKQGKILQLKITLRGSKPPIWRRILISDQDSFYDLHRIIQRVFDWDDLHLHEFSYKTEFGREHLQSLAPDGTPVEDGDFFNDILIGREDQVRLEEVFARGIFKINYIYDFGDNWEHIIKLEKVFPYIQGFSEPFCVYAKGAPPPEDCGGIEEYVYLLEAIEDEDHPEHEEALEWFEDDFDPHDISIEIDKMSPKEIEKIYGPSIPLEDYVLDED